MKTLILFVCVVAAVQGSFVNDEEAKEQFKQFVVSIKSLK